MAIWNEILEGGLNQLIVKRLAMQQGSPTPAVSPELQACLVLETERPEWEYLKGAKLMQGFATRALDAVQFSSVGFRNPAGSNTLAVITAWDVGTSAGLSVCYEASPIGTLGSSIASDFRYTPTSALNLNSAIELSGALRAAIPQFEFRRHTNASSSENSRMLPIVVPPGAGVVWCNRAVNNAITVNVQWLERGLLPGELA